MVASRARRRRTVVLPVIGALAAALLAGCGLPASASGAVPPSGSAAVHARIVGPEGVVDKKAFRALAEDLATSRGIRFRFGAPAATAPSADRPTAWGPADRRLSVPRSHPKRSFQLGSQAPALDDYSSDQGQLAYIPKDSRDGIGVDHVETLNMAQGTFSERPKLSWTYYGAGHPESDFVDGAPATCMRRLGVRPGRAVAQARAYAHGELTANSIAVFDNGVLAAAGTNTARGRICLRLPKRLHPSAISITNGNEFALITAWNTSTLRAELAVVALGGRQPSGTFWKYEWANLLPGFRNYGLFTFAKYLGSIPLPMAAPTSVSAVSDYSFGDWLSFPDGRNALPGELPLTNERYRQTFIDGVNEAKRSRAGYAIVASRAERKVTFIDLQPLFEKISGAYFSSRARFDSVRQDVGLKASEWPRAFGAAPSERPRIVRTIRTASPPTAVAGMLSGPRTPWAYVAARDGKIHVFSVGGLASTRSAQRADVRARGSFAVGANPTSITYVKDRATGDRVKQTLDDTLIVTVRGRAEVEWIRINGARGRIVRTLRDSRLVDPITAEDNNTHGTESYVLSVADYGAARLFNFRYGPVIFHTNGGAEYGVGPRGRSTFEFGGAYDPHGRPFAISVTNVT